MTKCLRMNNLYDLKFITHSFGGWTVQDQDVIKFGVWWRRHKWHLVAVLSHGGRARQLPSISSTVVLILFKRTEPLWFNYLFNAPSVNTVTLEIKVWHMHFKRSQISDHHREEEPQYFERKLWEKDLRIKSENKSIQIFRVIYWTSNTF